MSFLLGLAIGSSISDDCNYKYYKWDKFDYKRFKLGFLIISPICIGISAYYTIKQNNIIVENRIIAKNKLSIIDQKHKDKKLTDEYINNPNIKIICDIFYNNKKNIYTEAINSTNNNVFIYSSCVGLITSLLISPIFVRSHVGFLPFRLIGLYYGIGGLIHYCTHIKSLAV